MAQDYSRLLEVKNDETGQVSKFTITMAGLYAFAKFLALDKTPKGICRALDFLYRNDCDSILSYAGFTYDMFRKVITRLEEKYAILLAHWWDRSDLINFYSLVNMHYPINASGAPRYREDLVCVNGLFVTKEFYKNHARHCEYCHSLYFDQVDLLENHFSRTAKKLAGVHLLGYDDECADCCGLTVCHECGLFTTDYEIVDGQCYCRDCFNDNFIACYNCGNYERRDSDWGIWADDGRFFCCEDCAEEAGYHFDDNREEWTKRSNLICDYHDHKGCLSPVISFKDKRVKQTLLVGTETEVDSDEVDQRDFSHSWYKDLLEKFGNYVCFENDGSLNNGFEIITNPMSVKDFMSFDWETPYKKLRDAGWGADDQSTTGKHIHYSKGFLGNTRKEQENSAKKVCRFFQLFWDDIVKISRRYDFDYCYDWGNLVIDKNTDFRRLADDRYHAVNLTNMEYDDCGIGTIEIRICQGTINAKTTLASVDFFLHIVRNAKRIAWKNIGDLKLWFKGIKDKNTIDYIKSRNAFVGSF